MKVTARTPSSLASTSRGRRGGTRSAVATNSTRRHSPRAAPAVAAKMATKTPAAATPNDQPPSPSLTLSRSEDSASALMTASFLHHPHKESSSSWGAKWTTASTSRTHCSPRWRSWSRRATRWPGRRPPGGSSSRRTSRRAEIGGPSRTWPPYRCTRCSSCDRCY
uniref:(northern house mosquito) hypothetical protein n=1 Tax=Culex pipiens TaxID=7175 RepID=A0A8D8MIG3_CULPI